MEASKRVWLTRVAAAVVAGMSVAACGDAAGPGGTGEMAVVLQESGTSSGLLASVVGGEASGDVPLSAVAAVEITLERVEALPVTGEEEEEGAWVSLAIEGDPAPTVDLVDLSTSGGLTVARGDVPAGAYTNVRLFFSEATITLDEAVSVDGASLEAGTYDLFIPSGMQTGVKIPLAGFELTEGESETVVLEIDTSASIQTVVYAPGQGFIMNSVLIEAEAD